MKCHFQESIALVIITEVKIYIFFKELYPFRPHFGVFDNFKLIIAFGRR